VTYAGEGASAWTRLFSVHVPAPRVEVVDTVGAGDSFMAAALAVLVDWELTTPGPGALSALDEDAVRFLLQGAVGAAAVTCGRLGADPPRREDLPATWPAG
jgi:fructokinase